MRNRALLLVAILGVALLAVGRPAPIAAQARKMDTVNFRMSWIASGQYAMYAYGVKSGLYEAEGIDLRILEGTGSGPIVQSIGAGTDRFADVDINTTASLVAKGMPVKIIGSVVQTTPASIIFPADRGIRGPKDLEGKKVAMTPGDANHQLFKPLLRVNNVDASRVHEIYFDPRSRPTALMTGQVDAMGGFYTQDVYQLEEQTKKKFGYFRLADWGVNLLSRGIILNTKYLGERDLNCRFMRATVKSWEAAEREPDAAVRALLEMFPKAGGFEYNRVALVNMVALKDTKHSRGKGWGWMAREDWDELLSFQKTYGGVANPRPHADYYTNEFLGC